MTKAANRLGLYADIKSILDQALAHGGGEFECLSHGLAVNWRQRANQFRKLFATTLGPKAMSPYDSLIFPQLSPDSCTVVIRIREVIGTFRPAGPAAPLPFEDDALLDFAKGFEAKLSKGDM